MGISIGIIYNGPYRTTELTNMKVISNWSQAHLIMFINQIYNDILGILDPYISQFDSPSLLTWLYFCFSFAKTMGREGNKTVILQSELSSQY